MRIQFLSDLHLESRPKTTFERLVDVSGAANLALLGDIAPIDHPNLRPFLEWCSERWETVLYVPGHTELVRADRTIPAAVAALRQIAAPYQNVHVLFREAFYSDDGFLILATPYWMHGPSMPQPIQRLHSEDIEWIKEMIKRTTNPVLLLTHVGPVSWVQLEDRVLDPERTGAYTEVESFLRAPIVAWLFGHVHETFTFSKQWSRADGTPQQVLLACNGLGPRRLGAAPSESYRMDAIVRLDASLY
jgi:hypothetical protein